MGLLLAEDDVRQVGFAEDVLEETAALVERFVLVMAIEHRQIKGEEGEALELPCERRPRRALSGARIDVF